MELAAEIAAYRDGRGDPARLVGEFRRAVLLAPLAEGADGGLMSAVSGGIRWLYAFTDEEALARFAQARGAAGQEWEYLSILGARLVDAVVPMAEEPAGVAVNVADEDGSMLFPPVAGIVADAYAVDVDHEAAV
ncbi:SseB family protein [Streptomyces sp. ISL-36]|uniref:SseB family protein n=1 Tax=Streptomyces sp. ISL-36 TaxID=2819182 RepID=UPI001BEAD4E4|nr:SseB family protein [Streptomyces sp. ISL-36]MBT2442132.1 SseB family protein [Streptomyces sp. ISL-36]